MGKPRVTPKNPYLVELILTIVADLKLLNVSNPVKLKVKIDWL